MSSELVRSLKKPFIVIGTSAADYIVDGTSDDVQFQAAIDANAGMIFVKKATYNFSAAVILDSNTHIYCEPGTLFVTSSSDHNAFKTTLSGTTKNLYSNIQLENVKVESHKGSCIVFNNTNNVRLINTEVYFSGTTTIRQGIYFQHCQNIWVDDAYAHDYTGNGISFTDCDNFHCTNPTIDGGSLADDGIDIDFDFLDTSSLQSTNGTLSNVLVKNIGRGNGVRIENSSNITVNGIKGESVTSTNGAVLCINSTGTQSMKNIVVNNVIAKDSTDRGILIQQAGSSTIKDVILDGIEVDNCGGTGGSNIRGGIVINAPNVSLSNFRIRGTTKTGNDGGGLVIYQKSNIDISHGYIADSVTGLNIWNGDAAQTYTGINIKGITMSGNTTNYAGANEALTQIGVNIEQSRTVFNVRDFGALGDGSATDTSAIQAAITNASTRGGCVYFPRGTYKTGGLTVSSSNISFLGDGKLASKLIPSTTSISMITIDATGTDLSHIKIENLNFDSNSVSESRSIKLDAGGVGDTITDVEIRDCAFANINTSAGAHIFTTSGIASSKGTIENFKVTNCDLGVTNSYHIRILGDDLTDFVVDRTRFHDSQKGCIKFEGTNTRTYQDWEIRYSKFFDNSLGDVANTYTIGDVNRVGVVNFSIHHSEFKEDTYTFHSQNFAIHVHPGWNFRIEDNTFSRINTALAIGASNNGDQFQVDPDFMVYIARNTFKQCRGIADHDASIYATWDDNKFYEIITQGGIGTFSRHYPSKYINNFIYNSPSAIEVYDTSEFTFAGIYISPGVTYQGNTVVDDRLLPDPSIAPDLTQISGGSLGARTYDVVYTWENDTGETVVSPQSSLSVSANKLLVVSQPYSSTVGVPTGAKKVNVYVSPTSGGTKTLQDFIAVPWQYESQSEAGGRTIFESGPLKWTEPTTGLISGSSTPSANTTRPLTIYGILELTSSSTIGLASIYRSNEFYGVPVPIQGNGTFKRISRENLANGYFKNTKRVTSGAMTSGSATLTVGASSFVAGDVGKTIIVFAAGANGIPLYTTISAFTSGTQVTLAANAQATVSSKAVIWGDPTSISNTTATLVESIPYSQGNVTGATTFNVMNGETIAATLTGNITVTLSDGHYKGQKLTLLLTQDGTGSRTVTWPGNFKKAGGTLTLTTTASAIDKIIMEWDDTNWIESSRALNVS